MNSPFAIATVAVVLAGNLLTSIGTSALAADAASDEGRRIFTEVAARDTGYGDQQANVAMQLKRKSGATTTRLMEIALLEVAADGARTILAFNSPFDVKGTKVLSYSHPTRDDEQWIYLPAFKRVKQIADANKTTSFMGSEFTYEDLNSLTVQLEKFSYRYLRTAELEGKPCLIVERLPRYARSGYKRQVVWIDKSNYVVVKVEYYDLKDAPLKTLTLGNIRQHLNAFWRADEMTMLNHQSGDSTVLTWSDYKFKTGLAVSDFSAAALKR